MMKRITTSTEGKKVSFSYEGAYYLPDSDKKALAEGLGFKSPFWVAYTTVVYDRGDRFTEKNGVPHIEPYDNGYVGYQSFTGFNTIEEAKKDFKLRERLTPKLGIHAYCDVFLIEL